MIIDYFKKKYYWTKVFNELRISLDKFQNEKYLLFGYPKSGNTWLRFLIFNYFNLILNKNVTSTLTYDHLNKIQNNIMDRGTVYPPLNGFPFFYRTHQINNRCFNLFDFKLFIHRNPLDTLVSSYYFYKNRLLPFIDDPGNIRNKLDDIDYYVLYKIDKWIDFYLNSLNHADIIVNYSDLVKNPELVLLNMITKFGWDLDKELINKSVKISSFSNVSKMAEEQNQLYGNGPNDGSFTGNFTRSGKEGQFHNELKLETINRVYDLFPKFSKIYPSLDD